MSNDLTFATEGVQNRRFEFESAPEHPRYRGIVNGRIAPARRSDGRISWPRAERGAPTTARPRVPEAGCEIADLWAPPISGPRCSLAYPCPLIHFLTKVCTRLPPYPTETLAHLAGGGPSGDGGGGAVPTVQESSPGQTPGPQRAGPTPSVPLSACFVPDPLSRSCDPERSMSA